MIKKVTRFVQEDVAGATTLKVKLPFDERKKSRLKTESTCGTQLGFMLPRGHILRSGTKLEAEDGTLVEVLASPEEVSTVKADDPVALAKAAYHLGNRHVSLQIGGGWLRYQHDHVLDEMVQGFGLTVVVESAPFEPEDGAYAQGGHSHSGGHSHGHSHSHSHNNSHSQTHDNDSGHSHDH